MCVEHKHFRVKEGELKVQHAGLRGIYGQKWNIIFSLVYNPLKVRITVFVSLE